MAPSPRFMTGNDPNVSAVRTQEREWQERQGGGLQEGAYGRPGTRVVIHRQFARVFDALRPTPGMRLLDLGCGVGHLLAWIAARISGEYHGLDLSLNNVASARRLNPRFHVVTGDAERLPYEDAKFD